MSETVKYNKDGTIAKKRGRKPKSKPIELPNEIQELIKEVEQHETPKEQIIEEPKKKLVWDVKIGDKIDYFDKRLSYELTGYRPITETEGLDFRPEWFTEARDTFIRTDGHYCSFLRGSKGYRDFWNEEYRRCRFGLTVNGYTITGFNYYFLNYYQLPSTETDMAGSSRSRIFPKFFVYQYFLLCQTNWLYSLFGARWTNICKYRWNRLG